MTNRVINQLIVVFIAEDTNLGRTVFRQETRGVRAAEKESA